MAIIAEASSLFEPSSTNRVLYRPVAFTLPPLALGFCIEVENAVGSPKGPVKFINAALSVESSYLEPNIGQIWPR